MHEHDQDYANQLVSELHHTAITDAELNNALAVVDLSALLPCLPHRRDNVMGPAQQTYAGPTTYAAVRQ